MQIKMLVAILVLLLPTCAVTLASEEKRDASTLELLLSAVKEIVPTGWSVDLKLSDATIPSRPGEHPALFIKSDGKLPVEYFHANPSAKIVDKPPKLSSEIVTIYFVAVPFMSQETYTRVCKNNDSLLQKRIQFQREQLKAIRWGHMGAGPIPPHAFRPQTKEEALLVRQYAFLWISTQPKALPTHYTNHLSFNMRLPGSIKIHNFEKSKEYNEIINAVQKIIFPYNEQALTNR